MIFLSLALGASHPGECTTSDPPTECATLNNPNLGPYCMCKIKPAECVLDLGGGDESCTVGTTAGSFVCSDGDTTWRYEGPTFGAPGDLVGYMEDYAWNACTQVRTGRATTVQLSTFAAEQGEQLLVLYESVLDGFITLYEEYLGLLDEVAALQAQVDDQAAEIEALQAELSLYTGCDGYVCADGSCVASPEVCATAER